MTSFVSCDQGLESGQGNITAIADVVKVFRIARHMEDEEELFNEEDSIEAS
jgi:hypothetical protein